MHFVSARTFRALLILLALALSPAMPSLAAGTKGDGGSGREHTNMHEGLDALRKAKTSAEPLADLNAAYHRLKQGKHNKEGYRVRAMNLIERAMESVKAKEKIAANKLIDEAITVIEKAVAVSPDRR